MLKYPSPLRGDQPGTWAHDTIIRRLPDIARRTLAANNFPPMITAQMEALIAEIPYTPISHLDDSSAADKSAWNAYISPYQGQNWLEVPWLFAEHYFYRRILQASGYFHPGPDFGADPFRAEKQAGLITGLSAIRSLARQLSILLHSDMDKREALLSLFYLDLWGNQADLSLWPADGDAKPDHAEPLEANQFLLVDQAGSVVDYLMGLAQPDPRVDFLVDNAGFELVADLALADYLLTQGIADQVNLHLKAHPTFVSDAIPADVRQTVGSLSNDEDQDVVALGQRCWGHLKRGQLRLRLDYFWNSPLACWDIPVGLFKELGAASLVISKGDANYRRLLGDRDWPFTTAFEEILSYFPAPLVALRTLKSELASGLKPGQEQIMGLRDPHWLTNGRWGLIQWTRR